MLRNGRPARRSTLGRRKGRSQNTVQKKEFSSPYRTAEVLASAAPNRDAKHSRSSSNGVIATAITGATTGAAVVCLNLGVEQIQQSFEPLLSSSSSAVVLVPAAGGIGVAIAKSLPGVPRALSDGAASVLSLGSRVSLGPEGPAVDAGRAVARLVSRAVHARGSQLDNTLAAAGAAAGLAGGFGASVSGAFFAVEVQLQRENDGQNATAKVLLSSAIAGAVSRLGLGDTPAFALPEFEIQSVASLPLYLPVGVLAWTVAYWLSVSTTAFSNGIKRSTDRLPTPVHSVAKVCSPAAGGLCVGLLTLHFPLVAYQGFANFEDILWLREPYTPEALVTLIAAKVVATAASRASGLAGGLYAPSLFLGACIGAMWGELLASTPYVSQFADSPQAYAIVGMASMLVAVCKVPLTGILLTYELTRDYRVILPLMTSTAAAVLLPEQSDTVIPISEVIKEQKRPLVGTSSRLSSNVDGEVQGNNFSPAQGSSKADTDASGNFELTEAKNAARLLERFPMAARSLRCGEAMDARIASVTSDEPAVSVAERMATVSAPLCVLWLETQSGSQQHVLVSRNAVVNALLRDESMPAKMLAYAPTTIVRSNEAVFKALRGLSQAESTQVQAKADGGAVALVLSEANDEPLGFLTSRSGDATELALAAFTGDTGGRTMNQQRSRNR